MSLSQEQYDLVCKSSDQILSDKRLTEVTIATSWINIIRWHPEYLKQYQVLFKKTSALQNIKQYIFRSGYYILVSFYKISRSLFVRDFWKSPNKIHSKVDVVFISHLVNSSEYGRENDFYYGDLTNSLHDKNINSLIVKIDHTNNKNLNLIYKWNKSITPRVVLRKVLPFMDEIKVFISQRLERNRIKNIPYTGFIKKVANELSYQVVSSHTTATMRTVKQIQELLKEVKPRFIVTTFEGFAWERLVYSAAKEIDKNIKCIGYQHAAIFQLQHSIQKIWPYDYNPDWILASGKISKITLDKIFKNNYIGIDVLGSLKSKEISTNHKNGKACLVTPETFKEEKRLLFDFSLKYAKKNPAMKFIWRLHPKTSFDDLNRINSEYKTLPNNVVLSSSTLAEDLQESSFILYRGSTTVINAISSGVIPIYLKKNMDELSFDPIYSCTTGKSIVISQSDFDKVIEKEHDIAEINFLRQYGQSFYTSMNVSVLERLINSEV